MNKQKVALLSTVANFDYYKKSATLFPQDIQRYIIDGTNGMHGLHSIQYIMTKLKNKGVEWLVIVDEDVIFTGATLDFEIINEMKATHMTVCGVVDGGDILHRKETQFTINTFFRFLILQKLKLFGTKKKCL